MVEYTAVGLPVVSTPLSGVKSYFGGEPSVRLSEFDGEQFAKDVLQVLNEPPPEAETKRLAKRVATELDWKIVCRNAVNRLETVMNER